MKELISLFINDIKSENPTRRELLLYGFVYPLAIVAVCVVASALLG